MSYTVKEIFYSVQGEGARAGRVAVFCRFAGCNLWSGREEDRAGGCSAWCDTDFVGGAKYASAEDLAWDIYLAWHQGNCGQWLNRYVVFTGGEPALQLDEALVKAVKAQNFEVAVETNGSKSLPPGIDWVTVSPKPGAPVVLERADEVKLVHPQAELSPAQFDEFPAAVRYLQPKHDTRYADNLAATLKYVRSYPRWRISLQLHKILEVR